MKTNIDYSFFYQNGEPWFFSYGVVIVNDFGEVLHTELIQNSDLYSFESTLHKVMQEGYELRYEYENRESGTTSQMYSKTFKG